MTLSESDDRLRLLARSRREEGHGSVRVCHTWVAVLRIKSKALIKPVSQLNQVVFSSPHLRTFNSSSLDVSQFTSRTSTAALLSPEVFSVSIWTNVSVLDVTHLAKLGTGLDSRPEKRAKSGLWPGVNGAHTENLFHDLHRPSTHDSSISIANQSFFTQTLTIPTT